MNPIAKYREQKGLTQVGLALLLGVSQPTVAQFETGGIRPGEKMVSKLATLLGIKPEALTEELLKFYENKRHELRNKLELRS
ncbi:MAG TPA: XRE family transcriptional regulator [Candidatus Omnitrophica bacterium]|nr:XRE family transcriptional regulator [Candidatus Omnitrophota bacterium]